MSRPVVYEACILSLTLCIAVFMTYHLPAYRIPIIAWYSVILYGMLRYIIADIRGTQNNPQSDV